MLIDPDVDELKALIAKEGFLISAKTEMTALTASADGFAAYALVLLVAAGALGKLGEDLYDLTKVGLRKVVTALWRKYHGGLRLDNGEVCVVLEEDLPPEAISQLREPLPDAPSGVLRYNRVQGRWVDEIEDLYKDD